MSKNLSWPMWNLLEKTWQYQPWSFLKFPVFFHSFPLQRQVRMHLGKRFGFRFGFRQKKIQHTELGTLSRLWALKTWDFTTQKALTKSTGDKRVICHSYFCYLYLISISLNILDQSECWTLLFPSSHSNVDSRLPTACEVSFQLLESSS